MKFKAWLNSGGGGNSYTVYVDLQEYGVTDEEWNSWTEDDQESFMREFAFQWADWGYVEIE